MTSPQRHGFTLVELLVVIGIIALLVGLLLPTLSGARVRAKAAACMSNMRQVGVGVTIYADENRMAFPLAEHSADPVGWLRTLVPYGIETAVRLCPEDRRLGLSPSPTTSYLTNDHMQPLRAWTDFHPVTRQTLPGGRSRPFLKVTDVRRPSLVGFVVESDLPGDHVHVVGTTDAETLAEQVAVTRHGDVERGWSHVLYVDSSVRALAWPDLRRRFGPSDNFLNPELFR